MAREDSLQDKIDDLTNDVLSLRTKLEAAHALIGRVANEARVEVTDDGVIVDDDEAIIPDELFEEIHTYCIENDIEVDIEDDDDGDS